MFARKHFLSSGIRGKRPQPAHLRQRQVGCWVGHQQRAQSAYSTTNVSVAVWVKVVPPAVYLPATVST
jgi:hypothetical protein